MVDVQRRARCVAGSPYAEGLRRNGSGADGMKTRGMTLLRRIVSICLLVALTAGAVTLARRLGSRSDPERIEFLHSAGPLEGDDSFVI